MKIIQEARYLLAPPLPVSLKLFPDSPVTSIPEGVLFCFVSFFLCVPPLASDWPRTLQSKSHACHLLPTIQDKNQLPSLEIFGQDTLCCGVLQSGKSFPDRRACRLPVASSSPEHAQTSYQRTQEQMAHSMGATRPRPLGTNCAGDSGNGSAASTGLRETWGQL